MTDQIAALRQQLSAIRDESLDFFTYVDRLIAEGAEANIAGDGLWDLIDLERQTRADDLRRRTGRTMGQVAAAVKGSALLGEPDMRDLSRNAKRMRAALRFRLYEYWDLYVEHDEDQVLGVRPPSQSEDRAISARRAREVFIEAYNATAELLELASTPSSGAMALADVEPRGLLSYRKNTAFIMMWISREMDDVRDTVKEVFKSHGIAAIRVDEIEHEGMITDRIIQEIASSEFLFADLTGERPSVYYEVGYAHAIGKRVILFRKVGTQIHFDLAGRKCPEYENLGDLRRKLEARLNAVTGTDSAEA